MRIFLDQDAPYGIRRYLKNHHPDHEVVTAAHQRWELLKNGALLKVVEDAGFEVFVTADQNLQYQQNLKGRKIALVVLGNGNWPIVQKHLPEIAAAIDAATPNSYAFIEMPLPPKRPYVRSDAG
jgi:hypothetical protein